MYVACYQILSVAEAVFAVRLSIS